MSKPIPLERLTEIRERMFDVAVKKQDLAVEETTLNRDIMKLRREYDVPMQGPIDIDTLIEKAKKRAAKEEEE